MENNLERNLNIIHKIISKINSSVQYVISGSTSLAFQGVDIIPNDVDIFTDKSGVDYLYGLLRKYVSESPKIYDTDIATSYYLKCIIDDVKVEIIGDFKLKNSDGTYKAEIINWNNLIYKDYKDIKIPLMSLSEERIGYEAMGRIEKVGKIDEKLNKKDDIETIIPTAILTSYPRTFTDIPYSKDMFESLPKYLITDDLKKDILAPELEARFKLVSNLLKKTGIKQVFELASGYSTRGLELTKNDSDIIYVESDLKEVVDRKIKIINSFTDIPNNLHILAINVLDKDTIKETQKYFDDNNNIAIINEGLLRYLDFDEKKQVALNIKSYLQKYGGVWITCDVTPKRFIANQDKNIPNFNKDLSNISRRNNSDWRFENIEHVKFFYGDLGFEVKEFHEFLEVKDELVSPKNLNLDNIDDLLKDAIVVVMKLK